MDDQISGVVAQLSDGERAALESLPVPHDGDPARWIAARPYGSTWRKSTKHRPAMEALRLRAVVESTVSRGETLWRLTKPLGLAVRNHLTTNKGATE